MASATPVASPRVRTTSASSKSDDWSRERYRMGDGVSLSRRFLTSPATPMTVIHGACVLESHALSDRIILAPDRSGGGLADHDDRFGARAIEIGKGTPADHRNPERIEVAGRHLKLLDDRTHVLIGEVTSFHLIEHRRSPAAHRNLRGHGRTFNARQRAHSSQGLAVERDALLRVQIHTLGRIIGPGSQMRDVSRLSV